VLYFTGEIWDYEDESEEEEEEEEMDGEDLDDDDDDVGYQRDWKKPTTLRSAPESCIGRSDDGADEEAHEDTLVSRLAFRLLSPRHRMTRTTSHPPRATSPRSASSRKDPVFH
jgi:hypothetical protein